MKGVLPWHCLVCCHGYGGNDLPSRVFNLIYRNREFKFGDPSLPFGNTEESSEFTSTLLKDRPPQYVLDVIEGSDHINYPEDLAGVLVIQEPES